MGVPRRRNAIGLLALAVVASTVLVPAVARGQRPPNVILILTDDQRSGTVQRYMPIARSQLAERGVTFVNAVVTNPLCCPSRASILTGEYAHTHGVYGNRPPSGFAGFDDGSTIATWLQGLGYRTGLIGKYLNGYEDVYPDGAYVPPGWDRWFAFVEAGYLDYTVSDEGSLVRFGTAPEEYSTDVMATEAETFVSSADGPFFLLFAPNAPHEPATPAARHVGAFANLPPHRPPAFDEADVSDKPAWIRSLEPLSAARRDEVDALRERQLESLLSVDEAVGRLLTTLEEAGKLQDTLVIFTSDNGFQWGEHRIVGKNVPYRDTHVVPLIMRLDGVIGPDRVVQTPVGNIDLAPTIADVVGMPAPDVDGLSLTPLFAGGGDIPRGRLLIEHGRGGIAPPFCAIRNETELFIRYATGEEEYYAYEVDPHELVNRAELLDARGAVRRLRNGVKRLCSPLPPGMEW